MKRLFNFIKQLFIKKSNLYTDDSDIEKYYEDNVTILDCGSIVNKHEYKERGY